MRICLLLDGEGNQVAQVEIFATVDALVQLIKHKDAETIVIGEFGLDNELLWEFQFNKADVMPSQFRRTK